MKHRTRYRYVLPLIMLLALPVAHATDEPAIKYEPLSSVTSAGGQDRFIITYRTDVAGRASAAVVQDVGVAMARTGIATNLGAQPVRYLRRLSTGAELVRTGRKLDPREANALMRQLAADPAVLYVEPDTLVRVNDAGPAQPIVPNDPMFGYQWHLRPGNGALETIGKDTTAYANRGGSNASMAWHLSEGEGVVVAVLDTGITQHPDLDLSLADAGYDFIVDKMVSGRTVDGRVPGGWDTGDWVDASQCGPGPPRTAAGMARMWPAPSPNGPATVSAWRASRRRRRCCRCAYSAIAAAIAPISSTPSPGPPAAASAACPRTSTRLRSSI
jgi:serine protease